MKISGTTKVIPILAYPSEHVRTPYFFNKHCVENAIDAVMVPWKTHPDDLFAAFQSIRCIENISGVVVTIPHKQKVAEMCDSLEGTAALMGVCNVIRKGTNGKMIGQMFDGLGFITGLRNAGHAVEGKSVLLAGAGGAATAIAYEMATHGVKKLGIRNRAAGKAAELAGALTRQFPDTKFEVNPCDMEQFDLAINGTSLGMHEGDPLPFEPSQLRQDCLVAEVVMQPDHTSLLIEAERLGRPVHKGVHMVTAQIQLLAQYTTS